MAIFVGAVFGPGVLALPALAAHVAGPASILAWVGLLVLSVPVATTFAALGARHPDGGGVATYVTRAFGDWAAAPVGWWFYFMIPVGAPAAAWIGAQYVGPELGLGRATTVTVAGAVKLDVLMSITSACLAAVTVAGMAAAVALLPRRSPRWWASVAGTASTGLVLFFTGAWAALPLLLGATAVPVTALLRRRRPVPVIAPAAAPTGMVLATAALPGVQLCGVDPAADSPAGATDRTICGPRPCVREYLPDIR